MPGPPLYRRFGNVDFDSMGFVTTPVDSDQFVCRQGNSPNLIQTREQIRNPVAGEPTLIIAGTVNAPGLAFILDLNTGIFQPAADQFAITAGGVLAANFVEAAGVTQVILPTGGTAALPTLAFDGDTGLLERIANNLAFVTGGIERYALDNSGFFLALSSGGGGLRNSGVSATSPTVFPDRSDLDTGIGHAGADQLSLIAGALDCINISEVGAARLIGFYVTAPIVLQTGVAVTAAGVHAAMVNLGLITA